MDVPRILEEYEATPLNMDELSSYESWAYGYFHDRGFVSDPLLEFTLQHDITDARQAYDTKFCKTSGASFTAYLTWCMVQTIKKHPSLSYRKIEDRWYDFKNLPIFFPVVTNTSEKFHEIYIENAFKFDWPEFCIAYRKKLDEAFEPKTKYIQYSEFVFHLSFIVANMRQLQFTSFSMHKQTTNAGRSCFYFGKRYKMNDKLMTPIYISCDHTNADPTLISSLIDDFSNIASFRESADSREP